MKNIVVAVTVVVGTANSIDAALAGSFRIKSDVGTCLTDSLGFSSCDATDAQKWILAGDGAVVTSSSQKTCIDAGQGGGEWGDVALSQCTSDLSILAAVR